RLTPQLLSLYFRYVRNLTLMDRRLTPDLYTLVVAAKQTGGDDFALAVAETAREYPVPNAECGMRDAESKTSLDAGFRLPHSALLRMGINEADVPGRGVGPMANRLPGQSLTWRTCELRPRPPERDRRLWKQRWNPYGMCSWPPEDERIESFQTHV